MLYLRKKNAFNGTPYSKSSPPDWAARFKKLAAQAKDPRLQSFYNAGTVDGDTPISKVPLVAMDFETTGLDPESNGIVSIGLVPMDLNRIRCSGAQHWILKPREELSSESIVIHGITHSEVARAPDIIRILDELLKALAGKVVVVHHRGIERPFLNAELLNRIGEGCEFPVIDTMELEARVYRSKPRGIVDRLLGRHPTSIRLADSRARYNLPFYSPHHALTDALASAELLQAQIADRYSPDTPIKELWK
ncbi:DNA polymerase III subunit epsilon [Hahella sp. CCB-MM4]|uniref:3'-5' exonuclease n=1 Tax=Hahella sp. (strain CCB-MM4) TaxID=1926491 RepID=UPI000B9B86E1|nr:3'-5' exonuclease [Hahella sp. CCB-MM4]OZG70181.1 DNA polymerase III subunit epsilon [Hahella sp. CCB-MM4]